MLALAKLPVHAEALAITINLDDSFMNLQVGYFETAKCFECIGCLFYSFNFIVLPANAWEEGDEIVLITCRLENPNLDMVSGSVKEKLENFKNELYEILTDQ